MSDMRISPLVIALTLLTCVVTLVVLGSRSSEPTAARVPHVSRGPSFEVQVSRPRNARPFFGLLPTELEAKLRGDLERFDHESPGARLGRAGPGRLELGADGWDLSIETDEHGGVSAATRLVFPLAVGGRRVSLRCRPEDPAIGYLRTTPRSPDELDGSFLVELTSCENTRTGKPVDWPPAPPLGLPPAPLTVRGSFVKLPLEE